MTMNERKVIRGKVGLLEQVIVVDVLHSRSDLPRRLAALGPPKDPEQH